MRILVDTHVLIWATIASQRLSETARAVIENEDSELLVSAATAWEIATKVRRGRLPQAKELEADFLDKVEDAGYELLPVDAALALRAARLQGAHGEGLSRLMLSQKIFL
jgi:PIN domain nuclease of toxin-antitoxin system